MEHCTPEEALQAVVNLFRFEWLKYALAAGIAAAVNFVGNAPGPWRSLLVAVVILVAVDFASGMIASVVAKRVRISSRRAGRSFIKLFCYLAVLVIAFVVDDVLSSPYTATLLVLSIVAAREGISALENIRLAYEVTGRTWPFDFLSDRLRTIGPKPTAPPGGKPPFRNGDDEE